jgi:hypothetical protein
LLLVVEWTYLFQFIGILMKCLAKVSGHSFWVWNGNLFFWN